MYNFNKRLDAEGVPELVQVLSYEPGCRMIECIYFDNSFQRITVDFGEDDLMVTCKPGQGVQLNWDAAEAYFMAIWEPVR